MRLLLLIFIIFSFSCKEKKRYANNNLSEYQKNVNNFFKDASVSPLQSKDLKNFKGLDFFESDSTYIVSARIQKTPESLPFKMKTTSNTPADFRMYGKLIFNLKNQDLELFVYENLEYIDVEGYENYLFLPFSDQTNGFETYGGGRYIDIYLNENDFTIIDFNKAYNPQCVYNENYSCPIVPRENNLKIRVEAGVKNFRQN
tara:strand:+ start:152 stop:754 length:603 start_codon:yes stop_codon:yes gene_type:complete